MDHDQLQTTAHEHLLLHFSRNGSFGPDGAELLVLERGDGPHVFDTRGQRYIDALSSLFCAQLGYSHGAEMAEAAGQQMQKLAFNTNWATAHPAAIELAERLSELAPAVASKAFFTGGGSEAVEAAWKVARQFHIANGEPGRRKAIAREIAYHGSSLGALALTGVSAFKDPFGPPAIPVARVSTTNSFRRDWHDEEAFTAFLLEELETTILAEGAETVAMIIAEPVQNAGGCFTPPAGYWEGLRQIADRYGILLVADEVITGFGRIGEWLAVQRWNVRPDMVTVAKGLTAAYAPMGALLVSERVAEPLYADAKRPLLHGVTFGGHPVAAAVALKCIEIFERDDVLDNVRTLEPRFEAALGELKSLPIVGDVRGAGFFWAVELVKDEDNTRFGADERERLLRGFLPRRLLEAGLIARADDRGDAVVQLAPPLVADAQVLDEIAGRLGDVLSDAAKHMGVDAGRQRTAERS